MKIIIYLCLYKNAKYEYEAGIEITKTLFRDVRYIDV